MIFYKLTILVVDRLKNKVAGPQKVIPDIYEQHLLELISKLAKYGTFSQKPKPLLDEIKSSKILDFEFYPLHDSSFFLSLRTESVGQRHPNSDSDLLLQMVNHKYKEEIKNSIEVKGFVN